METSRDSRRATTTKDVDDRSPRVVLLIAAVPVLWVVAGLPTVGLSWASVLILISSILRIAARAGWRWATRSMAEYANDDVVELPPLHGRALHAFSTARRGDA